MSRIVLCTSSSGLDNLDIKTKIRQIRLRIYINNVEFIDGKNITINTLKDMMRKPTHSPVHTKPAPENEIAEMLTELEHEGFKEVFIVSVSSSLSDSYHIIKKVAERFKTTMDIYVYDCKEFNVCEAMLALEAEYMMAQGESMTSVISRLDDLRAHHKMLFPIQDLTYLIKNKKLSQASGFVANLFSIKPILQVSDEGKVVPISKVRKYERALDAVIENFAKDIERDDVNEMFTYVLSAGCPDLDKKFVEMVKKRTHLKHVPIFPVSAISLANLGPTGVGLCSFLGVKPHASKSLN